MSPTRYVQRALRMKCESAVDSHRSRFRRIGRLVCGVAAATAALAGVAAFASAQPVPVTTNPTLTAECGLKVMLVLDESASISTADVTRTRDAANAFVGALTDTGSQLAITSFALNARTLIGYTPVTTPTTAFTTAINGFATGTGLNRNGTNWDAAFRLVRTLNGTAPANLVVFVTDGNPNTYILANGNNATAQENAAGWTAATPASITAANAVKAPPQNSRIFAMGVGAAVSDPTSQQRLQWISGPSEFGTLAGQNPDFATSDWTRVTDFTALRSALTGIVAQLCGSRLLITKRVLDHNGNPVNASGWTFTANLSPPGGHTWLEPALTGAAATGASASLTTGSNGIADFQWRLHSASHRITVGVTHEQEKSGFKFVDATCRNVGPDGPIPGTQITSTTEIPGTTLGESDFRTCDVLNQPPAARLTVVKRLEPIDDTGTFNLLVNGTVESPGPVGNLGHTPTLTLPLGTHTVSETPGPGTAPADYDTSIQCSDLNHDNKVVAENTGQTSITVDLTTEDENVVCTITNESTKFGDLTVIKHLLPASDPGKFDLVVGGTVTAVRPNATDGDRLSLTRVPFGPYSVTERAVPPTDLANYEVTTICTNEDNGGAGVAQNPSGPSVSFELNRSDNDVVCVIENRRGKVPVAHLTVVKHLVPSGDAGAFDLLVGGKVWAPAVGDGGSTGRLEFELGKHTVTEHGADRTDLAEFSISTTCVDKAHGGRTVAHNAHGPSITVDLSSQSDDVVCTITNKRTQPPGGGGELPDTPGPHLGVDKQMPAHVRVGEDVPFTITVHNLGHGTAHGVQLHETPPTGMRIVGVANHGSIQADGTAVWHLGNLAPGESRTVRGTLRVTHTGLHVNTAVATALNSDPALSDAAVRARGTPPAPPPPTVTG